MTTTPTFACPPSSEFSEILSRLRNAMARYNIFCTDTVSIAQALADDPEALDQFHTDNWSVYCAIKEELDEIYSSFEFCNLISKHPTIISDFFDSSEIEEEIDNAIQAQQNRQCYSSSKRNGRF